MCHICGKLFEYAEQTIFSRSEARGQGHIDPETKCDTLSLQDVSTYKI